MSNIGKEIYMRIRYYCVVNTNFRPDFSQTTQCVSRKLLFQQSGGKTMKKFVAGMLSFCMMAALATACSTTETDATTAAPAGGETTAAPAGDETTEDTSGKEIINLYAFTEEVPTMVQAFLDSHPDFAAQYAINKTVIPLKSEITVCMSRQSPKEGAARLRSVTLYRVSSVKRPSMTVRWWRKHWYSAASMSTGAYCQR